jgi:hypothetical protein
MEAAVVSGCFETAFLITLCQDSEEHGLKLLSFDDSCG